MSNNINNKKALAEKIKIHLNDPFYTAVSEMPTSDDYYAPLWAFVGRDKNKSFIDDASGFIMDWADKSEGGGFIYYRDLEPNNWEEIVTLIQQKKKEKEHNYRARQREIEAKMDSHPGLYYHYTKSKRLSFSWFEYPDKKGKYFGIFGKENGRTFWLNINANHPVLNNFPFQKNGYYLIKTDKSIERNDQFGRPWSDRGEDNENNFHKWIEVSDQITITPYEVADKSIENPSKGGKDSPKENNNQPIKNDNSNRPLKKLSNEEKKIAERLIQFFQNYDIKEIKWENNELTITRNNNETMTDNQLTNNSEYQIVKNSLQKIGKNAITQQELSNMINASSTSEPTNSDKNNNALLIGGGVLVLAVGIGIGLLMSRKNHKKNK